MSHQPWELAQARTHFFYLADSPLGEHLLEGVLAQAGAAFQDGDKKVLSFGEGRALTGAAPVPGASFEAWPPAAQALFARHPELCFPDAEGWALVLAPEAEVDEEALERSGLALHPRDAQVFLRDFSDWWLFLPGGGEPGPVARIPGEGGGPLRIHRVSPGTLFLHRLAEQLELAPPPLAPSSL
jgi:hypothetical protein